MAGKKENLKALFSNTRSRVIILFTTVLLLLFVIIGYIKFGASTGPASSGNLGRGAAGISSIPGSQKQTAQYAALQESQNIDQAQKARQKGTSAIPTIIRTQAFGEGVQIIGQKAGLGGVDFTALSLSDITASQKSLWIQSLKEEHCSKKSFDNAIAQGATISELRDATCSCKQLKVNGYKITELAPVCSCGELKDAGFDIVQMKEAGFSAGQLRLCGYVACDEKGVGFSAQAMKDAGFSDGELKGAGFSEKEIALAGGLPDGMSIDDIRKAGCSLDALKRLRASGVSAAAIRRINGCSVAQLKAAGFSAQDLKNAGFSAAELKQAGFSDDDLKQAGFTPKELSTIALNQNDCSVDSLKAARLQGISAEIIKKTRGCSAKALLDAGYSPADLKNAGFTAAELRNAGVTLSQLKNAGFDAKDLAAAGFSLNELKDAGFNAAQFKAAGVSADDLKNASFNLDQLKTAGFDAKALKSAGFTALDLRKSGLSAKDLKAAGYTADELLKAGFSNGELKDAGYSALVGLNPVVPLGSPVTATQGIPPVGGIQNNQFAATQAANAQRLNDIRNQQEKQAAAARYQQKIQQRSNSMLSAANQVLQGWKATPQQVYVASSVKENIKKESGMLSESGRTIYQKGSNGATIAQSSGIAIVKTGDILFAVIDTSVNTDEPGPILATIVSGRLKGSKLIGSFRLPSNADKMIVTFNTLSMSGVDKTISINAYAIDPNTARTALASQTDHHYLSRYGALFASTFLEGFGNAFQSANTTITIGGTGGTTDTTVQSGIGRSTLDNAVIGLATVGKAWGKLAAQNMNRPTTIQLYAGTGVGVLFTQDLKVT